MLFRMIIKYNEIEYLWGEKNFIAELKYCSFRHGIHEVGKSNNTSDFVY